MKAAVVHRFGEIPRYEDFTDPAAVGNDLTVRVKAAVLENFDRMTVSREHYASRHQFPQFRAVVGHSAVGTLEDGTLVAPPTGKSGQSP